MKKAKKILALLLTVTLTASLLAVSAGATQVSKVGKENILDVESYATAVVKADGSLWMWGDNSKGQLGNGTGQNSLEPVKIMDNVKSVSCGLSSTAAIKTDGSLWTWGEMATPTPAKVMDNVAAVSSGTGHMAAVKTDGSLWTWGENTFGQLGNGTIENSLVPVKIMDNVATVSCGMFFTAAIKTDGSLWLWGNNENGQIGNGGQGDQDNYSPNNDKRPILITVVEGNLTVRSADWLFQTTPVKVMDDVASVACGMSNTAAIKTDGSLWLWGDNSVGQLANGKIKKNALIPEKIMDNVVSVSCGSSTFLAIDTKGSLWGWGNSAYGELGVGIIQKSAVKPVLVMDNVAEATAGVHCSAAIKKDGTLWLWGNNTNGLLGFPDTDQSCKGDDGVVYCQSVPFQLKGFDMTATASDTPESTGLETVSDWAKDDVTAAYKAGIVPTLTGTPGFKDVITREQFAELVTQMLTVLYGESPDSSSAVAFSDCDNPKVIAAAAAGIVSGVGDNKFNPKATANREQIAAMVARAIEYIDKQTGAILAPAAADISRFSDKDTVSSWAVDGVGKLAANGIMSGTSATTLSPKKHCTVEESILLIYRLYEKAK